MKYTHVQPKDIKDNLIKLCQSKGGTLQDLATKSGINVHTIYNWEFAYPNLQRLMDIADCLDVSVEDIIFSEKTDKVIAKEKRIYGKGKKIQQKQI